MLFAVLSELGFFLFYIQSITNYLKDNEGTFILTEQSKLGRLLNKTRKKLFEKLVMYIFDNYTMYPSTDEIILVSRAACEIFDKLKDEQGGVVSELDFIYL